MEVRGPLHTTRSAKDGEPTDLVEEKLLQWQQARIQRQLEGEYQSQVFRLNELVCFSNAFITTCLNFL